MMRINNYKAQLHTAGEMLMLGTNLSRIPSTLTALLYSANAIVRCCWLPASRKPPQKRERMTLLRQSSCHDHVSSSCIISSSKRLYSGGNGENGNPDDRFIPSFFYMSAFTDKLRLQQTSEKTAAPSTLYTHLATT